MTSELQAQRGAVLMGRNMFGPVRGDWPDDQWRGWWGEEPPYHTDVFVLTHHAREPITMQGGTTFHFVTEGFAEGLRLAREAGAGDVRVAGGASTIRQALEAGEVDEVILDIVPVTLGAGERIFPAGTAELGWSQSGARVAVRHACSVSRAAPLLRAHSKIDTDGHEHRDESGPDHRRDGRATGLSAHTLRYYERDGLMLEPSTGPPPGTGATPSATWSGSS